jgi:hypothetical protein
MSGSIRVIHVRTAPEDTAVVIKIDRSHAVLGNHRHRLRNKFDHQERARVIELFRQDLVADLARKGPMYEAVREIVELVQDGRDVCLACHCHPLLACHGDPIADAVRAMVVRYDTWAD